MEFWLLVVIGVLLIIILGLLIKLLLVQKTAREIQEAFAERLTTETNTLIDISYRDKTMLKLANGLNTELRKLRSERHRFQQGDLELKEAVTNIPTIYELLLQPFAVIWICLNEKIKVKMWRGILPRSKIE